MQNLGFGTLKLLMCLCPSWPRLCRSGPKKNLKNNLKDDRRNLAYDLGRIAADFELDLKWGQCALSYFIGTYGQSDTVPIAWVYFQSARLAKSLKNTEQMNFLISKALSNLKESPDQILKFLLNELKL